VRVALDRLTGSARNAARVVPILRGIDPNAYENGYDVGDDSHPLKSDDGAVKFVQQIAYNAARMTGTNLPAPRIDAASWAANSVTLSSVAGTLTTTRILRGLALPLGQPKVSNLYFRSAGDPSTLHEVPDAAISLSGGDIVISALSLLSAIGAGRVSFQRGDALEFASGPAGANDAQDKTDDTWLDYPGIADAVLELVPLQPVAGVFRCDLAASGLTNLLQDFATWAIADGLADQGGGWFTTAGLVNRQFDSNQSGEIDIAGLTGGADSATLVVDVDRSIGLDGGNSTQVSLRDLAGFGHQRLRINGLWGEVSVSLTASDTQPTQYGWLPLPVGRARMWMHVSVTSGGRVILYLNNANTGGAYGFAGLYDGALTREQISAI
jgi:hypothetical protein